mgnify:FL=1
MLINPAFAQEAAAVAADPAMAAANPLRILFQFLVIFVVFYFFLIRPQQKKMKEHMTMQSTVARGDTVITNGGIVGKVIRSNANDLLVEIADGVRVVVVRDRILAKRAEAVDKDFLKDEQANDNARKGGEGLKDLLTKK